MGFSGAAAVSPGINGTMLDSDNNLGETVFPRGGSLQDGQLISGDIAFSFWQAGLTQPCRWIETQTASIAASGLTVAQVGIYTAPAPALYNIDHDVTLVLLAASANDLTLWEAAFTPYAEQLTSIAMLYAGQYYALAVLAAGTTPPSLYCGGNFGFIAPYLGASLPGQSSLPASISGLTLADAYKTPQAAVSAVNIQLWDSLVAAVA